MPDHKDHSKELNQLLKEIADTAAEDTSFADEFVRSEGLDPDELAHQTLAKVKQIVAQAKLDSEEHRRSTRREKAIEKAKKLRDKVGSAVEALQVVLEKEDNLALQFRKLESQADEEDAFAILVDKIELELSEDLDA